MPFFKCKWKDKYGNIVEKDVFGEKLSAVLDILKKQKYEVIFARPKKLSLKESIRQLRGVSKLKLSLFARQMATMLNAGITLVGALDAISTYEEDLMFRATLKDVLDKVYMGYRFSAALSLHKLYFSDFFVSLIRVGELSGRLHYALERISDYYERDHKIISSLKASLFYPSIIFLNGLVIFVFLMFYFVPSFTKTYEKMDMKMPLITKVLIGTTSFIINPINMLIIIGIIVAVILLFVSYWKTPLGKKKTDDFFLSIPLFGKILNKVILTRLLIGIEVLYNSGVALLKAISDMKESIGNRVYEEILSKVEEEIKQGGTLAGTLASSKRIPSVVSNMISVGEESGRLSLSFKSLVRMFEDDIRYALEGILAVIEPIVIVLLAIMIGFVVVALFLPLYNLISSL